MAITRSHFDVRKVEQLVLQGTSFCNLNCTYCDLSEVSRRTKSRMPLDLVLKLLDQLIDQKLLADELVVVWHSGEPLTLPPEYYADAIDAISDVCSRLAPETTVMFDFQTNATLINDRWCDLFEKYHQVINLGVSCDGPQAQHDAFRVDWKDRTTHERTLRGMNLLEQRGIKYNAIAVVTGKTLADPEPFFDFFFRRRQHLTDFHFNILASPVPGADSELSYDTSDRDTFYDFYRKLISLSAKKDEEGVAFPIRNFVQTQNRLAVYGLESAPNYVSETSAPLRSLNMDTLGNVTTFYAGLDISHMRDHYDDREGFSLGNIHQRPLGEMLSAPKFHKMVEEFRGSHKRCADECEYFAVCPGGFELTQIARGGDAPAETVECVIHVKTLTDALMDALDSEIENTSGQIIEQPAVQAKSASLSE